MADTPAAPPPDPEEAAFLAAFEKDPADYLGRVVYADWLDERGRHEEADRQRAYEEADRWLIRFAEECGETCDNYSETCHMARIATDRLQREFAARGLGTQAVWQDPEYRRRYNAIHAQIQGAQKWRKVTREDVVQAGIDYADSGGDDYWTQQGSENARDLCQGETRRLYWKHWSTVTGRPPADADDPFGGPFSCTC